MNTFWTEVVDFLMKMLTAAERIAFEFLLVGAKSIAQSGGALLTDAAMAAVRAAEETGGSGTEKYEAAFNSIVGTLKDAGQPVVENAVNLAIEAAVAKLKEELNK